MIPFKDLRQLNAALTENQVHACGHPIASVINSIRRPLVLFMVYCYWQHVRSNYAKIGAAEHFSVANALDRFRLWATVGNAREPYDYADAWLSYWGEAEALHTEYTLLKFFKAEHRRDPITSDEIENLDTVEIYDVMYALLQMLQTEEIS